jgi:dTDP-4-amino-4,6-dideoxy-D-galactose acyltransferase
MAANGSQILAPPLRRLDWESNHFGIRAEMLVEGNLQDDALAAALRQARSDRIQLLVWPALGGRIAPRDLLDEFAGMLVDRKATFGKSLQSDDFVLDHSQAAEPSVVSYEAATASPALCELALAAGTYSRFAVDPHIKPERFAAMYRRWIEGSVSGELADVVLVVPLDDCGAATGQLGGMITVAESDGVASIGLVAVAIGMRGRGIGSTLMRAAHRWMRGRNAREARVVTQLANAPACRLYERSGYRLLQVQHYYHFWP